MTIRKADGKPCQRVVNGKPCISPAVPGERYCKKCRSSVIAEMRTSGYLGTPYHERKPSKRKSEN